MSEEPRTKFNVPDVYEGIRVNLSYLRTNAAVDLYIQIVNFS